MPRSSGHLEQNPAESLNAPESCYFIFQTEPIHVKQQNRRNITLHSSSKTKDSNILYIAFLHSNVQMIRLLLYIFSCVLALSQMFLTMFPVQSNLSFHTIQLLSLIWSPVALTSGVTWEWGKEAGEFYSTWHITYYLACEHTFTRVRSNNEDSKLLLSHATSGWSKTTSFVFTVLEERS